MGSKFFFSVPGASVTSPSRSVCVTRISNPETITTADVVGAVLALAIFVSGLIGAML
jgi:hypothetical protein